MALSTRSGEVSVSSAAKATSRPVAATVSAISIARRDLPMPPGPTIVTSRTPGVLQHRQQLLSLVAAPDERVNGAGMPSAESEALARLV